MKVFIDENGRTYSIINGVKVTQLEAETLYRKENGIAEEIINYGVPETGAE